MEGRHLSFKMVKQNARVLLTVSNLQNVGQTTPTNSRTIWAPLHTAIPY